MIALNRSLLTLVLFVLISSISNAQCLKDIGLKYGPSYSIMTAKWPDAALRSDQKMGHFAVVSFTSLQGKHLGLVTDIGFIQKGSAQWGIFDLGQGYALRKITRDYISFTPMLRLQRSCHSVSAFVVAGPRVDLQTGYRSTHFTTAIDERPFTQPVFGLTYGAGLGYSIGKTTITAEYQGRPDITYYGRSDGPETSGVRVISSTSVIALGIRLRLAE